MNLSRTSLYVFFSKITGALITFLIIAVFARRLGADILGSFFLYQTILGVISIISDFGLKGALEKRVSESNSPNEFLGGALILKLTAIFLIVIPVLVFRDTLNGYIGAELAIYLIPGIIIQELGKIPVAVLNGSMRVSETANMNILKYVIWSISSVFLYDLGFGVKSLVFGLLFGLTVHSVIGYVRSSTLPRLPSSSHIASLLEYGRHNFVATVGMFIYNWTDIIIIGYILGTASVGIYETSWKVSALLLLFSRSISTVLFPLISKWHTEGWVEQIIEASGQILNIIIMMIVPAIIGIFLLSKPLLSILFGPEFREGWIVLSILIIEKGVRSIQLIFDTILRGTDRPELAARATLASVVVNILLNIVLIYEYGLIGAACATLVATGFRAILHARYVSESTGVYWQTQKFLWYFFSTAIMGVFIYLIMWVITIDSIIELLLTVFAGALVYFLVLFSSKSTRKTMTSTWNTLSKQM